MNVSESSILLFDSLQQIFDINGFKLNRNKREFKRKVGDCLQIFDLNIYQHRTYISVKPDIRIKVERIEEIYKNITQVKGRPFRTLGNHLFEIQRYIDSGEETGKGKESNYNWIIEDIKHIEKLVEVIPIYLEETMLPYFNKNSSVAKVDELLNKYPRQLSIHNYLYPLRVNIAIIAAKLNNNIEYEKLLEIYAEELEDADITYKEDFNQIKHILENY